MDFYSMVIVCFFCVSFIMKATTTRIVSKVTTTMSSVSIYKFI